MEENDFKEKLSPDQYHIMREAGTEPPFSGAYWDEHRTGSYQCAACGQELFSSKTKFDSGTGWPSFTDPVNREHIELRRDTRGGMERIEVLCKHCGSHLGHVFEDGPSSKGGKRYCINSACLNFKETTGSTMKHILILILVGSFFFSVPTSASNPMQAVLAAKTADSSPLPQKVVLPVPFTPQAPTGDWSKPYFQDGCEEAAVIMAMHWIREQTQLSRTDVVNEIQALAAYQQERFGTFRDLGVDDMEALIREYYHYDNVLVQRNISIADIKTELNKGNLVIVPANGRALKNPFFRPPGPVHHIVLIKGYDEATKQFITHDPGTRRGENYRYSYTRLYSAIREYPTGHHAPVYEVIKSMVVVKPWSTLADLGL